MTGEAKFNEVHLTKVRIRDSELLGQVGEGSRVVLTTLNEGVSIGEAITLSESGPIGEPVKFWKQYGRTEGVCRDRLASLWIAAEVNRPTNIQGSQNRQAGLPNTEGTTGKIALAKRNKAIYELGIDRMGAGGVLYGSYEMVRPDVAGASSSVERELRLPGDVHTDKDVGWIDAPLFESRTSR
jgi:hypothetical protein